MKPLDAPKLERRRATDFERELLTRARTWIPSWSLDESEADFGLALLKIAARFNSEVAERLDKAGNKMALGFLDWLGLPASAPRPARMPVVLKMAETSREPVLAPRPVKMQVDAAGSTVTFETETSLQVIPGQLAAIVAVDPEADAYYLPPPGLTSLDSVAPLPTAWKLKNFAAPESKTLQLDPGIGLAEGMLVEIDSAQYRIAKAKDDLVTIDPVVPAGDGFVGGARVAKVGTFRPFDGARNLQEHILYIGDPELLNIEAEARIEVSGLGVVPDGVKWEYWGKSDPEDPDDADARWRVLTVAENPPPSAKTLILEKPKGELEALPIGAAEARWIRGRLVTSNGLKTSDSILLKINPATIPPAELTSPDGGASLPPVDIFVNATPSTPANVFLFGQEPRLLDSLYIGCPEAFSKAHATAWISFELSGGAFEAMTAFDRGAFLGGPMLAAVDKGGMLNLFSLDQNGKLIRFNGAKPLQPEPKDATDSAGASNYSLTSWDIRPAVWIENSVLCVAVASKGDIWLRKEPIAQLLPSSWPFYSFFGPTGQWDFLGAPGGDADSPILGMALVMDGGSPTLVVLTAMGLFKRPSKSTGSWSELAAANDIQAIATVQPEIPATVPSEFLLVRKLADGTCELCTSSPAGNLESRIQNVDPAVQPFGAVSGGTSILVAATTTQTFSAWKTGGATTSIPFGIAQLGGTAIDGTVTGGQATIYCAAVSASKSVLLRWLPFEAQLGSLLFESAIDLLPGAPKGAVAVLPGRTFLPGNRKGEVLGATFGTPAQFAAAPDMYRSAVAILPSAVASTATETVAVKVGSSWKKADVEGGRTDGIGPYAGSTVLWLDKLIDRNNAEVDAFLFLTIAARPSLAGTVRTLGIDVLDLAGPLEVGDVLLVNSPGGSEDLVEIIQHLNPAGDRVKVKPALNALEDDPITYRVSDKVKASFHSSLKLDGTNGNNDWDSGRAVAGGLYFPSLQPKRQAVIAYLNDQATPPKPQFVALQDRWTTLPSAGPDIAFIVANFSDWTQARASPAATAELAWEYWNGTGWWHLPIDDDQTSDLRQSGILSFIVPSDLKPTDWAGKTSHWIRARIIAGDYGEAQVSVIQESVPNTVPPQTKQTVVRDPSNLQPPYASSVRVAYAAIKPSVPQFVLTRDSGSTRDQSDANRTLGALVEIFTPLGETLARFDAPAPQASDANSCSPDCECDTGTPSMSPVAQVTETASTPATATATATGAGRRALYLGFTSKLLGQPVNVLFNVDRESDYDAIGPLRVDALVGDRFAPIVATDDTRALGETGILTMSFDVAPLKAELFGQALSWLRLAPRIGSADWKPSIAGAYPNGVWTRAAETMARELLGSSDGRPSCTVTLARPPLLQDTLELRVREPLGEEELTALKKEDPNLVKSNVTDLPGHWILWKQVPDPADCGPKDRVYSLDEATGTVRFGDGLHGMIPPIGVDAIVAFAYERTEPMVGEQLAANLVIQRTELNLVTPVESVETVIAADQSAGGAAPESAQRVQQFAPAKLRHRGRAVSLRDFEDLVRQKFEDVVQARAFNRNGRVRLVVVTKGKNPAPSRAQQRELRRTLLEIAPPALGVRNALTITGPRARHLRISLSLRVASLDVGGTVASEAKKRLVTAFDSSMGWLLGRTPREDDIAEALIDVAGLDGIVSIALFELDELGRERPWQGSVGADYLVLLAPEDVHVGFDVMEAAA